MAKLISQLFCIFTLSRWLVPLLLKFLLRYNIIRFIALHESGGIVLKVRAKALVFVQYVLVLSAGWKTGSGVNLWLRTLLLVQ